MTSYQHLHSVDTRIACDATGCDEVRVSDLWGMDDWDTASRAESDFRDRLVREGWTCWASHSQRHYCPIHAPRPGHSMRLIWGEPR